MATVEWEAAVGDQQVLFEKPSSTDKYHKHAQIVELLELAQANNRTARDKLEMVRWMT